MGRVPQRLFYESVPSNSIIPTQIQMGNSTFPFSFGHCSALRKRLDGEKLMWSLAPVTSVPKDSKQGLLDSFWFVQVTNGHFSRPRRRRAGHFAGPGQHSTHGLASQVREAGGARGDLARSSSKKAPGGQAERGSLSQCFCTTRSKSASMVFVGSPEESPSMCLCQP